MTIRKPFTWTAVILGALCVATPATAAVCDLTSAGSTCTVDTDTAVVGDVIYTNANPQPTGTGYIDPFLRLQRNGDESGYNTSADYVPSTNQQDFQFDQKNPSFDGDPAYTTSFLGYTHDLLLSSVPIVTIDGIKYREFWLDINEPNGTKNELLSLDQLQIFLSPTGGLGVQGVSDYNTTTRKLNNLTAIYDLDAGGDNYVKLDYDLGSGSGSGDMTVYIPDSLFKGGKYVYLYSQFGLQTCCGSADGFEEWWVKRASGGGGGGPNTPVPEPASLLLVGTGLVFAGNRWRKRGQDKNQSK